MRNKKQTIQQIKTLRAEELEEYIESRYEARAPQAELDALETIFAGHVSEDDLTLSEEEVDMREAIGQGAELEELLSVAYARYLQPPRTRAGLQTDEELAENMRAILEEAGDLRAGISNQQIFDAAKDLYERKKALIAKYKSKGKMKNIVFTAK
ncbi:MAG: hypothetical protein KKH94_12310 [Candidatus Omnitrophica bacterium]|nr:hypothetical protein [Candidatus Omnitrophota bacterium]